LVGVEGGGWREDEFIGAWAGLLRLHAELVPVIDSELQQRAEVPLAWYDVLLELSAAPERRMRMSDLGASVVLSRTRVSRIVDELVGEGYVTRVPNPEDGRSAFAALTPDGYRVFRHAAPVYLDVIRAHLSGRLSSSDARQLRRLLEKALG
jgi:DNA-binding MarR family transcriptional regulator